MKVYQMLPTLAYGDAIGNDVVALGDALEESGYETAIYAKNIEHPYIATDYMSMQKIS